MSRNEKGIAANDAPINNLKTELTMKNNTPNQSNFQLDLFSSQRPRKTLETIHCCNCQRHRELDGYRFKLVPVCSDCRTERDLEILSNQIERRAKR
jgi:hypothetical protein